MYKRKIKFILSIHIILIILLICSIFYIFKYHYDIYNSKKERTLLDQFSINEDLALENSAEGAILEKTERMLKLEELQKTNSDIKGWLEIENTNINYPVLQGTDNSFYMTHNYKKQYSMNGAIFLDKDFCWNPPSSNLLIYGHNNRNNTMFQDLLKYTNIEFYNAHPTIRFTTNNEDSTFDIISVFQSKVYYKSEKNVFRYYYFVNSNNEAEYNQYVQNAKKASLYNIDKSASYGEQLMTLSTCSYHTADGRFAIVAKKVSQ